MNNNTEEYYKFKNINYKLKLDLNALKYKTKLLAERINKLEDNKCQCNDDMWKEVIDFENTTTNNINSLNDKCEDVESSLEEVIKIVTNLSDNINTNYSNIQTIQNNYYDKDDIKDKTLLKSNENWIKTTNINQLYNVDSTSLNILSNIYINGLLYIYGKCNNISNSTTIDEYLSIDDKILYNKNAKDEYDNTYLDISCDINAIKLPDNNKSESNFPNIYVNNDILFCAPNSYIGFPLDSGIEQVADIEDVVYYYNHRT